MVESITVRFYGAWNGLNRDLSLHHQTAQGRAAKLDVEDGAITDDAGHPLVVEHQSPNGWTRRYHIYVPGAVNADRTIIIRYRVKNAIRFFYASSGKPALDELYWNVTGNGWSMFIDSVRGRVVLPDGVMPTQLAVYTGYAGVRGTDGVIQRDSNEVVFRTTRSLYPYQGITVAVGWAAGHISSRPSEVYQRTVGILRWIPLLIPFLVLALAYRAWNKNGRDPPEGSFVVRYEPVAGATPAELGTLIDNSADMRDITATLVDLAVRGYVHITELSEEHLFGLTRSTDYKLDILRKRNEWTGLKAHEVSYLDALGQAAPSDAYSMKVSELRDKFYKFLPEIKNAIYDELVAAGYYRERPDTTRGRWFGFTVLVAFVLGGSTILSLARGWIMFAPAALVIAAIISVGLMAFFAQIMPARTEEGARAREATLGFKEFLSRVEEERYRKMITSPEMFEKYLPYAMAFGVEKNWAKAFRDIYRQPPQWYTGGTGPFNVSTFSNSIGSMTGAVASSMSSSPGSGGGGSSGGGSGGGGGSGF
ncbi:MAG TPA: DUF2207 domain-containing protein [Gemmatimonadaceae bacterium]